MQKKYLKNYKFNSPLVESVKAKITPETQHQISEIARHLRIPQSLLISRAIMNELACERPFHQVLELPEVEETDSAYDPHTSKLYDFIKKWPGLYLEYIYMFKDEIGIPNKEEFLAAFAKLLKAEMIEAYQTKNMSAYGFKQDVYRILSSGPTAMARTPPRIRGPLHEI